MTLLKDGSRFKYRMKLNFKLRGEIEVFLNGVGEI